ncbi:hypothetical protein BSL82_10500 [Tardibacter chloracetimidivorans]|uniref:Flavin reductase like domain-containing protein n=1 Tax=Tardibacter chloracetimidivorans TaxID=1921510 RepID=A0A1L3ZZL1_9SPHN|nr:hypothetical protein BSL82_10500 [Tardibacter chloracetimidivorans]
MRTDSGATAFLDKVTPDVFKTAFRNHPAGVAVITADACEGPVAFTATSVCSINVDPPLLAFSISDQSSSAPVIRRAETFVVHLLGAEQYDLAVLCATSGVDRFADASSWDRLPTGEPFYRSAQAWIRGRLNHRIGTKGAHILIIEALDARIASPNVSSETLPLVYHDRTWHHLTEASRISR